ncbi:hypothetical protein ES705_40160 [subsurface metagenome]
MHIADYNPKKRLDITKFVGSFLLNYHNTILKLKKMSKGFKLSLKILDKKMVDLEQEFEVVEKFRISRLIIPFSVAFKKFNPPDIYNGEELIPFEEKDLEFKEIFIHEFLTESNNSKRVNKRK